MAAVEVPIRIGFNNETSKICLEPESGPSAQPVLSLALSMQIPIAALVNALAEFQSKYDAEQGRQISIAKAPEPKPLPNPAPGLPAPPPLTGVAGNTSAPLSAGLSAIAPTAVAVIQDHSTPKQMPAGALTGLVPASSSPAVAPQPAQLLATHDNKKFTFDTEVAVLHHHNHEEYVKRTKWSGSTTTSKPLWHLADESCLVDFVPTPLTPPRFGRSAHASPSVGGPATADEISAVPAAGDGCGPQAAGTPVAAQGSALDQTAFPPKAPPQPSPSATSTAPLRDGESHQSSASRPQPPPPPPSASAPPLPHPPAFAGETEAADDACESSAGLATNESSMSDLPSPPPGLTPPEGAVGGTISGAPGLGGSGAAPRGCVGLNSTPKGHAPSTARK